MKILTRNECAAWLLNHDHYTILSHRRPDGDTIGSTAALCLGLRQLGRKAHVLYNEETTSRFAWLHEGLTMESVEDGDVIVSVDVASPGMLPKAFAHLIGKIDLRIGYTPGLYVGGNIGYSVDEKYRGRGYAGRACRLLLPVMRYHQMKIALITNDVRNTASRRVCEKLGLQHLGQMQVPNDNEMYARGIYRVNIYAMEDR